tara:strand:+ start:13 stop:942 length:930 start_codon:yes stop_codon:yes gene_type:complete
MQGRLSQTISWNATHKHDFTIGTHWDMINDPMRNEFYNELLQECKDKVVIDVGFGTGILSMLALKHGATLVYAYEMCHNTYLLGKHIIQKLGLEDKIILTNAKFNADSGYWIGSKMGPTDAIIIHEIVGCNLWDENLICLNNIADTRQVVPNIFNATIYAMEKPDDINFKTFNPPKQIFNPGVDFGNNDYINLMQNIVDDYYISRTQKFSQFFEYPYVQIKNGYGGHGDYVEVGSYTFDINKDNIPKDIVVDLDIYGKDIVIWAEYAMNNFRMTVPSWKNAKAVLCTDLPKDSSFIQNTGTGTWWIECP